MCNQGQGGVQGQGQGRGRGKGHGLWWERRQGQSANLQQKGAASIPDKNGNGNIKEVLNGITIQFMNCHYFSTPKV